MLGTVVATSSSPSFRTDDGDKKLNNTRKCCHYCRSFAFFHAFHRLHQLTKWKYSFSIRTRMNERTRHIFIERPFHLSTSRRVWIFSPSHNNAHIVNRLIEGGIRSGRPAATRRCQSSSSEQGADYSRSCTTTLSGKKSPAILTSHYTAAMLCVTFNRLFLRSRKRLFVVRTIMNLCGFCVPKMLPPVATTGKKRKKIVL